jgi:hypothetical protein
MINATATSQPHEPGLANPVSTSSPRIARGLFSVLPLLAALITWVAPSTAQAGFAETLPRGTFLLDINYNYSWLEGAWDNQENMGPLIPVIERYEPGGGKQGTLIPDASVRYQIMVFQLQYGILDYLSFGIGIPLVIRTEITPRLRWIPGDFQPQMGRPYSEQDFWEWAESMGQPRPRPWVGNQGVLGDIVLGARLRWSDWIPAFDNAGVTSALTVAGALPTGKPADPEEVVAAGTTMWDLQTQGNLSIHLGVDKRFGGRLDDRLTLGLDVFYDWFAPRRFDAPSGERHPLLMNFEPFIGTSYIIDPGDFIGFSVQADVVPWKGPARASWISGMDSGRAAAFPPLLTVSLRYTFQYSSQTDYSSQSDLWDYTQEDRWRPGYRNILTATVLFSFLRLGAPLQVYATYRSLSLIPGRNARAADVFTAGIRIPAKFW